MEASKVTKCQDERHDLCDDNLQQPEPAPQDNLGDQLTSDIQKDPPKAKRPRSKAQQEAFAKAQRALKEKRAQKAKETKQSPVKLSKAKVKTKSKPTKKVVYEVDESSDSSSDEEVVYVQRKKPRQRKPKQKKPPRVVYVTDSEDEDEVMEDAHETPQPWYNFV